MLAVKIRVRIHHLRLDPQSEVHPQRMNLVDQRLQPVRKLLRIYIPVAEAGMVVFALTKPSIVHHKAIDAKCRSFFCERHLALFADVEFRRLPRVVDNWTRLRRSSVSLANPMRKHMSDLIAVQKP